MLRVGIIGATGYTGEELIEILLRHPEAEITYLAAKIDEPLNISEIFPRFKKRLDLICAEPDYEKLVGKCDLVFLALPHTVSMHAVKRLSSSDTKIIDLSADYRLKDAKTYKHFYHTEHKDKVNLSSAVYGLPELYRQKIKNTDLVANPGCYPTAAILAIAPILTAGLADENYIFIDAKSGATGAGRRARLEFFFAEINENFKAYKVNTHQHIPEIDQELSKLSGAKIQVNFVPHLLPLNRGILETIYLKIPDKKKEKMNQNLIKLYERFYQKEPFVRILDEGKLPEIKDVVKTNFCDIGIQIDQKRGVIIIVAAIDNLLKGAAGQAVQNMNIMYDYPETTALL